MKNRSHYSGFTLLELALVVLIIGLLASIVLPQYLDNSAQARFAACRSNMRNLATQEMLYYATNSSFTDDILLLDFEGVLCPFGLEYIIIAAAESYRITCPADEYHGQIDTGLPSWNE